MDSPVIGELASLDILAYELQRDTAAAGLGIRVSALDKLVKGRRAATEDENTALPHWNVEPSAERVDGAALLNNLRQVFRRYVVLSKGADIALPLWVLHAWTMDAGDISPLMVLVSPTKRCGKTSVLIVLYFLTPRSELASNITASALFRYIEEVRPTLLIDEQHPGGGRPIRFRADIEGVTETTPEERKSNAGRKPYDAILKFKIVVLQSLHNLSDEQTEYLIRDRLSFMRLLDLELEDPVPDATTIWLFREGLAQAGLIDKLFERFGQHLEAEGYIARGGQIIDATIVPVPKQRNTKEENEAIKAGKTPEGWEQQPAKNAQKDKDARWTKKNDASFYGYKNHVGVDKAHKLIRKWDGEFDLDLGTVLSTVVAKAVQLSGTEAGSIYVVDSDTHEFHLRASHGMSEDLIAELNLQVIDLNEKTLAEAASQKAPMQVADLKEAPLSPVLDILLQAGYRALLIVPLRARLFARVLAGP